MRYAPALLEIDFFCAGGCLLACVAGLFLCWRQHLQARRALGEARCQIVRLAAAQQSLRDAERRRIGRDLHDDLGQHLLALGMSAATLTSQHPALHLQLAPMQERVRQATRALRSIVHDLDAEALESGLEGAVQQQIAQFSRLSGVRCRLDAEPAAFAATPGKDMDQLLYRVLQESLSNIVRHAHASEVCVGLCRQEHSLSLTVRDNGVGLPQQRRGHGLRGIAERVAEAGGRFDIASMPGVGTALTMSFPLYS
ncbi:sensor histidine kinase [Duganella sp. sic0402]|uniref:sensor histidine kinase n=1 Tax=Duganella sp. sic0402 TaxID=2854786 RepID=UPI001C44AB2D|nr:sensor histidine kinase [Duganella sp. sic0402]MBV7534798.1 sensor histidine kinase [Duganella sp. sic0402]